MSYIERKTFQKCFIFEWSICQKFINLIYSFIKPKPYGHLLFFICCRNNKSLVFKMVIDKCLKRMQLNSYKYFSRKQCFIRIDSINWILEFVHFMLYPFSEIVPHFWASIRMNIGLLTLWYAYSITFCSWLQTSFDIIFWL